MPIASLIVRMGADLSDLLSESKKATTALSGIEKQVKAVGDAFKAYFSAEFILGAVEAVIEFASSMTDLSTKTGIGTEALQEFSYAGKMVGVSIDQITGAIGQMQDRLAGGDKGALAALTDIKVSVEDLKRMNPEEQFKAIARGMAAIEDPAKKVSLMKDVFGKAGADLIPLIDNLDAMTAKARELGLVLDEQAVAALDDFGDSMDTLKTLGTVLVAEVLKPMIPGLTAVAQGLSELAAPAARGFADALKWLQDRWTDALGVMARGMGMFRQFQADYLSWGQASKGFQEDADYWKYIADHIHDAAYDQKNVADETKRTAGNAREWKDNTEEADRILKEALAHQKEIADILDKMWGNDVIEKFQNQLEAIDVAGGQMSTLKSAQLDLIKQALEYYTVWKETGRAVDATTQKAREILKLTPEGLLQSKSRGTTAGALDVLPTMPDEGDQTMKAFDGLDKSIGNVTDHAEILGVTYQQTNAILIESAKVTDAAAASTDRNARSMQNMTGQTQQGIATMREWTAAIDDMWRASGESEFGVMGAFTGMTQSGVGTRWTPRGYATGTDGYEYFGNGTPVMLHGWEKVTPKGAGGGDGATVVTVNMSGMMLSNNPTAKAEVARYINTAIADSVKRSRKFSY